MTKWKEKVRWEEDSRDEFESQDLSHNVMEGEMLFADGSKLLSHFVDGVACGHTVEIDGPLSFLILLMLISYSL